MNKVFSAYVAVLLLALHFSSQVQAQNGTVTTPAPSTNRTTAMANYTTAVGAGSSSSTVAPTKGSSASVRLDALTLLFPTALVAFLLHGRF